MFHRWIPSLILALILVCFVCAVAPCAVIRVTTTGNNSNDGSTWALAKLTIDNAITAASSGDEVWVKVGSYAASTTISLKEGVNVYGGFAGTESSRQDRTLDWQSPSTVDGITNYTDNGSVFIAPTGVTVATILDGFKVTGGSGTLLSGYYLGGGIYVAGSGLTISNCHIEGNTGNKGAGILALTGTHTHIHNCTVSGNDGTLGAGIYVYNGEVLDSIVTQNGTAANCQYGGGIRVGAYTSDCLIQNTEISHNACANRGGGIYVDTGAAPTIEDCDIHENETVDYGAGIFATSSSPVISGCSIKANKLYGTGGGSRSGAGIAGYTISPQITDCTIEDNYIVDSASTYGAGIYVSTGSPVIRNNIIRNNDSAGNGSGVMLTGTIVFDVSENIIYGNDCVGNLSKGGGIAVYGTSYGTIERNKIYSNTAVTKGGGIYFSSTSDTATTIKSNLIYSNSATDGSGVYILSGTCPLYNNTIAANSSDGVYVYNTAVTTTLSPL